MRRVALLLLVSVPVAAWADGHVEPAATRWGGVRAGSHAVGFDVRVGVDPERRVNATDPGTRIGIAIWYPADRRTAASALTTLDYRLLTSARPLDAAQRHTIEEEEIGALMAWRHVGIVELTREQARASLATGGIATRAAPPASGRFPVVLILGGQYYLATTAEILASHGFLVAAPFRFVDQANEIGTMQFTWSLENSVRDAEWALRELEVHPQADLRSIATLGHGGGGVQALLLAMRNRRITAVANLDAGNFSTRTGARNVPFYSPRLTRAPYLYLATASTRKSQDLFDDFVAMRFSDRYEVILETPDLRHHDLSDLGRGVTAPLSIRGPNQPAIEAAYARSHDILVRFLQEQAAAPTDASRYAGWLRGQAAPGQTSVTVRPGVQPAPSPVHVLETLGPRTADVIRSARQRDPEAELFQPDTLGRIVDRAIDTGNLPVARAVSDTAVEIHPDNPRLLDRSSHVLEALGDLASARARAARCAALEAPDAAGVRLRAVKLQRGRLDVRCALSSPPLASCCPKSVGQRRIVGAPQRLGVSSRP